MADWPWPMAQCNSGQQGEYAGLRPICTAAIAAESGNSYAVTPRQPIHVARGAAASRYNVDSRIGSLAWRRSAAGAAFVR